MPGTSVRLTGFFARPSVNFCTSSSLYAAGHTELDERLLLPEQMLSPASDTQGAGHVTGPADIKLSSQIACGFSPLSFMGSLS